MARMMKFYPVLTIAALVMMIFGYVWMHVPLSVIAQGGSAVYQRLSVLGEVRLTDNQIQEAEIDIDNVPTDGLFLKWDNGAGKLMWGEVGFDTGDWSNPPGALDLSFVNCPDTPGGPPASIMARSFFQESHSIVTAVMATQTRPVLSYDLTLAGRVDGSATMTIFRIDSASQLIFSQPFTADNVRVRVTGMSSPLASGPVAVGIRSNKILSICTGISSVSMVPM